MEKKKVGLALYEEVMGELKAKGYKYAVLDTPSVAKSLMNFMKEPDLRRSAEKNCHFIMNILTGIPIYTC